MRQLSTTQIASTVECQTLDKLEAEFNRWTLSSRDFREAGEYLDEIAPRMREPIERALLSSAIVAYGRPFKRSKGNSKAAQYIKLPDGIFAPDRFALHEKLIELRDMGIAHSDFELKPTARVRTSDTGVMTWSKPFNPLSAGINIGWFREMAHQLDMHCVSELFRLNQLLNRTSGGKTKSQATPEGATITRSFKLSGLKPKRS